MAPFTRYVLIVFTVAPAATVPAIVVAAVAGSYASWAPMKGSVFLELQSKSVVTEGRFTPLPIVAQLTEGDKCRLFKSLTKGGRTSCEFASSPENVIV